jgi:hypothetical protein
MIRQRILLLFALLTVFEICLRNEMLAQPHVQDYTNGKQSYAAVETWENQKLIDRLSTPWKRGQRYFSVEISPLKDINSRSKKAFFNTLGSRRVANSRSRVTVRIMGPLSTAQRSLVEATLKQVITNDSYRYVPLTSTP